MSGVKITGLEIENLKRVKAVAITIAGKALTVIGGRNAQGKTSVLDGIMWALGGDRFKPTHPTREGGDDAYIKINLDNGVTVERGGVNGALKVTSSAGKGGQSLLNEFVNTFALNLPKFQQATGIEKANMLLAVFPGLGAKLVALNAKAKALFDERHALGVIADRKAKYADELPYDPMAPDQVMSGAEMTKRMQDALSFNARNDSLRRDASRAAEQVATCEARQRNTAKRVTELQDALSDAMAEAKKADADLRRAQVSLESTKATADDLQDADTTAIKKEMEEIDSINSKVRMNESKRNAEDEAKHLKGQYEQMTTDLEAVRAERIKLLASVEMPLAGLSLDEEGQLVYQGQPWDCMSGAEQLKVATAICAAVNPKCGFVLLDKLEAMDTETLAEFAEWLEARGLQAIGTRVGTGDECSIVIEDGEVKETFKFE